MNHFLCSRFFLGADCLSLLDLLIIWDLVSVACVFYIVPFDTLCILSRYMRLVPTPPLPPKPTPSPLSCLVLFSNILFFFLLFFSFFSFFLFLFFFFSFLDRQRKKYERRPSQKESTTNVYRINNIHFISLSKWIGRKKGPTIFKNFCGPMAFSLEKAIIARDITTSKAHKELVMHPSNHCD